MDIGKYLTESWKLTIRHIGTMVVATIVLCALSIVTLGILAGPLWVGMIMMYIRASEGKPVKWNDIFNYTSHTLAMAWAGLLGLVLVCLGLVLLIVPGLLVASWIFYSLPLIGDKGMGAVASMKASKSAVAGIGVWMNLLLILVVAVVSSLGGAAGGVGALLTCPLSVGMIAMAYKDKIR